MQLQHLLVQTPSSGAEFTVHALPVGTTPAEVGQVTELPVLGEGSFHSGRNSITLTDAPPAGGLILWITELPEQQRSVAVSGLSVIGYHAEDAVAVGTS